MTEMIFVTVEEFSLSVEESIGMGRDIVNLTKDQWKTDKIDSIWIYLAV